MVLFIITYRNDPRLKAAAKYHVLFIFLTNDLDFTSLKKPLKFEIKYTLISWQKAEPVSQVKQ
jgi:hypothetical protein